MDTLTQSLLAEQSECTLCWLSADGRPAATTVSFVFLQGKIWMTALAGSPRVRAIARDNRVTVVVSGKGSPVGHSRCVSIQGRCEISADSKLRDQFFPLFSAKVLPNSEAGAAMMASSMNSPENLLLIVDPKKFIPYDAQSMLESANSL